MKTLVLILCLACYVSACSVDDGTETSASEVVESENPALWFLGTWQCTGGYHGVPPFEVHAVTAVYSFALDVPSQTVIGAYVEDPDPRSGFAPVVAGEIWTVGEIDPATGRAPSTLKVFSSDGATIDAAGNARTDFVSLAGAFNFGGVGPRRWRGSMSVSTTTGIMFLNRHLEIAPDTTQLYLQLTCTRSKDLLAEQLIQPGPSPVDPSDQRAEEVMSMLADVSDPGQQADMGCATDVDGHVACCELWLGGGCCCKYTANGPGCECF